ncbi:MAG: hypothetical protein HRT37_01785 [Alteromonadaceae bacterium]|nr:hypothetical protein [Alteromonadaceae bacterium]
MNEVILGLTSIIICKIALLMSFYKFSLYKMAGLVNFIKLKHNDYQYLLHEELVKIHGKENVGTEVSVNGTSIDLVVKKNEDEYWFYEIKTASTAKACIRQALGQIFEYSYWPGHQKAKKLIIVGKPIADKTEIEYVEYLRKTFDIPIEYHSIDT